MALAHLDEQKSGASRFALKAAGCLMATTLLASCGTSAVNTSSIKTLDNPALYEGLAKASEDTGDYARAVEFYGRMIAQGSKDPEVWQRRGELLLKLGAVRNARAHYAAALKAGLDTSDMRRGYARALVRVGQPNEALAQFDQAIAMEPSNYKAMNGKGVALDMLGRHEEAQDQYLRVQEMQPFDIATQNNLALSYTLAGNAEKAIGLLETVYLAGQSTMHNRQNLAMLYGLTGQEDKAAALSRIDLKDSVVAQNMAAYEELRRKYNGDAAVPEASEAQPVEAVAANEKVVEPAAAETPIIETVRTNAAEAALARREAVPATVQLVLVEPAESEPAGLESVTLPPIAEAPTPALPVRVLQSDAPADMVDDDKPEDITIVDVVALEGPVEATPVLEERAPAIPAQTGDADIAGQQSEAEPSIAVVLAPVKRPTTERQITQEQRELVAADLFVDELNDDILVPRLGAAPIGGSSAPQEPTKPAYQRLAEVELAAMNVEMDAFGNALRVIPGERQARLERPDLRPVKQAVSLTPAEEWVIDLGTYETTAIARMEWQALKVKYENVLKGVGHYYDEMAFSTRLLAGPLPSKNVAEVKCLSFEEGLADCGVMTAAQTTVSILWNDTIK
jgi:Flp pilus assembly protein TadD